MGLQPPWEQSTGRYDVYAGAHLCCSSEGTRSFLLLYKEVVVLPACVHYLIKPLQFNLALPLKILPT